MERAEFEFWKPREVARLLSLVESERRYYQEIVELLPAPVAILSPALEIHLANRAFRQRYGLPAATPPAEPADQVLDLAELRDAAAEVLESGKPRSIARTEPRVERYTLQRVREWADPESVELVLLVEETAGETVQTPATDLAIEWEADPATMRFTRVNSSAVEAAGLNPAGWSEGADFLTGRIFEKDLPAVKAFYQLAQEGSGTRRCDYRAAQSAGIEPVWLRDLVRARRDESGNLLRLEGLTFDITAAREQGESDARAASIEAVSRVAGRVVHDCNNLLMIMSGYGEELLYALTPDNPLRANVQEILHAGDRLSSLAAKLTHFATRPTPEFETIALDGFLEKLRDEFRAIVPPRVELELHLDAPGASIQADRKALAEAFRALVRRAASALHKGGKLEIETVIDEVTDMAVEREAGTEPGPCVRVRFRDSGMAMHPDTLAQLFEPELSPDNPAHNLPAVYFAVRDAGGDIVVHSRYEEGSLLTITLPATVGEVEAPPAPELETVLVVEDEPGIRNLIRKMLERNGYRVLQAASGEEALELQRAEQGPIHLLLTDIVMPGMNGVELSKALREERPDTHALFISGYTGPSGLDPSDLPPGAGFLQKPFTLASLLDRVRELVAPAAGAAGAG